MKETNYTNTATRIGPSLKSAHVCLQLCRFTESQSKSRGQIYDLSTEPAERTGLKSWWPDALLADAWSQQDQSISKWTEGVMLRVEHRDNYNFTQRVESHKHNTTQLMVQNPTSRTCAVTVTHVQ